MGWRDRDWARFTDAERNAIYGASAPLYYPASRGRRLLAPGAAIAIVVTAGVMALGQFPRQHPLLPLFHTGAIPAHPTFPLNLEPTASYGSTLTINGTDPGATGGTVVATGQWNGGPSVALASAPLASDHTWSVPISMNEHGVLSIRIDLPSGESLTGTVSVGP